MSSIPSTSAASEIVSGLSGLFWATEAGVCTSGPIEPGGTPGASKSATVLRRALHLSWNDQGELVEEALGVLDDADHAALDTTDLPGVPDLEVEGRGHAAGHRDLVRSDG